MLFISYRRDDTADVTGRIHDWLARRFGRDNIFVDVDSLRPGDDFRRCLREKLDACRVFLTIIGQQWLDITDSDGQRRLSKPGDYVRREIEIALSREGLKVIPVLVQGAEMPGPRMLPESLRPLAFRQAAVVRSNPDFQRDIEALIALLAASMVSAGKVHAGLPSATNPSSTKPPLPHSNTTPIAKIRQVYPRAYLPWTKAEQERLQALWRGGSSVNEIAATLQRQPSAVKSRLDRLIPPRTPS